MGKINFKRVVLGGLLAGIVFIIVEFIFEGLIQAIFKFNERDLAIQTFENITRSGVRYHIVNFSYFIVFLIFAIWIYAAIRPRFGSGPKTAIVTSGIFLFITFLLFANFVNLGIFPLKMGLLSFVFNLVELPSAILAGASIYKEE